MTKRDYSAVFRDFTRHKETARNSYLRLACEIEPAIIETLPLSSFMRLTRKYDDFETNGKTLEIPYRQRNLLLSMEQIQRKDLLEILPNSDERTGLDDFQDFRRLFFDWTERYCFKKDWIIESALATLTYNRKQISEGKKPSKVLITFVNFPQTVFGGGFPKDSIAIQDEMKIYSENWTEFESRINRQMQELKKRYNEKRKEHTLDTKKFDLQQLKWLIWWNIKPQWTAYDIAINETSDEKEADSWKVKINNTIKEFRTGKSKLLDLPVRRKMPNIKTGQKTAKDFTIGVS
jgi:hypothetical protein